MQGNNFPEGTIKYDLKTKPKEIRMLFILRIIFNPVVFCDTKQVMKSCLVQR